MSLLERWWDAPPRTARQRPYQFHARHHKTHISATRLCGHRQLPRDQGDLHTHYNMTDGVSATWSGRCYGYSSYGLKPVLRLFSDFWREFYSGVGLLGGQSGLPEYLDWLWASYWGGLPGMSW